MKKEFELIAGLEVEGDIDVIEGFFVLLNEEKNNLSIHANVSASKQAKVFKELCNAMDGDKTSSIEWKDGESFKRYDFDSSLADWSEEDLDWVLQDGFHSLSVKSSSEEVFAGPLQVLYVNTNQPRPFKKILQHWFIRQKTHLQTLYTPAKEGRVKQRALKRAGQSLEDFLKAKVESK